MAQDDERPAVATEVHGRVLLVRIDRPDKRNALNVDVTAGIDAAMNRLEDDPDLWCGVLTGGPAFFSAGADLRSGPGEPTARGGLVGLIERKRTKPLVAAVEGFALGGGLELVLCCDVVVAGASATFGLPEVKRGLMPDFGGAFRIAAAIAPNVARELLLLGDPIPADRAERLGLVNRIVPDGDAETVALALAAQICENAPLAVRAALSISDLVARPDETELWEASHRAHHGLLASEDVREGITAFFERRTPQWQGR